MKSRTATAVAAGLGCASVEVAGAGFFGPLGGNGAVAAPRSSRKTPAPQTASRWLGAASGSRRGARKGVAYSLYAIRGGASGAWAVLEVHSVYHETFPVLAYVS